ncbi:MULTISPECIES: DUF4381 domain-containing protein [unclassified Ruegeria]|uniref:DUF4381 domain-containing protein n=1 Tax=unclassified Ruegeria TaxID=2625375 RepID=UPI0014893FDA|nr:MULTISPECIES: DUF4381 domain-containing protein [unclassified Ruegeria]NOD46171.1 DUF4381 family protein [Ruegeria sp. HKCCD5849]NOD50529.1 DUF4381 family protein [Ruegeria sp. HKCCD5851]NOD67345.1 DUF4381 family protein [Ruegeria sp. HKCCD7303]NOE32931.1 DUF4381 family protein [Ruegeria sp. HKCCD7318]
MSVDVEGKSLVDLLDMLEPAPAPGPVSMVPQTWGWVVLGVLVAGLIAFGAHAYLRHRRMNAYRREALTELAVAKDNPAKIAEILRRAALVAFPRSRVAALHGDEWISFLTQTSDHTHFSDVEARVLTAAPYTTIPASPELTKLAQQWIRSHKRERST